MRGTGMWGNFLLQAEGFCILINGSYSFFVVFLLQRMTRLFCLKDDYYV